MFFEYPSVLYLEILLIPIALLYLWRELRGGVPALRVSNASPWRGRGGSRSSSGDGNVALLEMATEDLRVISTLRPTTQKELAGRDTEIGKHCF